MKHLSTSAVRGFAFLTLLSTTAILPSVDANTPRGLSAIDQLSPQEATALTYSREEEKLAYDVYTVLGKQWGRPFTNIVRAEKMHMDAVAGLLKTHQLTDPISGAKPGEFKNEDLRKLYLKLIESGKKSRSAALKVGAQIEDLDLFDLTNRSKQTAREDLQKLYSSLAFGSRNHLRAFVGSLRRMGESYVPTHISQAEMDRVMNGGS